MLTKSVKTLVCALLFGVVTVQHVTAQTRIGPAAGSLVLIGGGEAEDAIFKRIIELAGGPNELIVVIPTARTAEPYDDGYPALIRLRKVGATNLMILHTRTEV